MAALSFKGRFVDLILDGSKNQTIRNFRKYPINPGETLYLYYGMRTKHCKKLKEVTCKQVSKITITKQGVNIERSPIDRFSYRGQALEFFAQEDGFASWKEMRLWWLTTHELPFTGQLIQWTEKT
jgi:predicted transcriptional regulator